MMAARDMAHASRVDARRSIDIWGLLVWAFQREAAQLDLRRDRFADGCVAGYGYASMTAIIAEHEQLGCRVDGGGRSDPHPDADMAASAVSVLSEGCGGQRMALTIAEHARADTLPDWHVETFFEPREIVSNQHGRMSKTANAADLGSEGWPAWERINRKGVRVSEPVMYCPVILRGGAAQVAARRRHWLLFRSALLELRTSFQSGNDLTSWVVGDELPPLRPWITP